MTNFFITPRQLIAALAFRPTSQQKVALEKIAHFLRNKEEKFFVLKGAAGTGKTSLLKAIATTFMKNNLGFSLSAPTGRAAKVIAQKTNIPASTVHRMIYHPKDILDKEGNILHVAFIRKTKFPTTPILIIVDEASMICSNANNSEDYKSEFSMLEDLFFMLSKCPEGSKILFLGDEYQLPPVGDEKSYALCQKTLSKEYGVVGQEYGMTEVKRQSGDSTILVSATKIRDTIASGGYQCPFEYEGLNNIEGSINHFVSTYKMDNENASTFIAWKNNDVLHINQMIRKTLFKQPRKLEVGDKLVMNKSHYGVNYIQNGEVGFVKEIFTHHEIVAGFNFAKVLMCFRDDNNQEFDFKTYINLDVLTNDTGSIEKDKYKLLVHHRFKNNPIYRTTKKTTDDPYLSALSLRYGYAITCHKAQGGEWDNIYLYPNFPIGRHRLKWIYTAITRAKENLYCF